MKVGVFYQLCGVYAKIGHVCMNDAMSVFVTDLSCEQLNYTLITNGLLAVACSCYSMNM